MSATFFVFVRSSEKNDFVVEYIRKLAENFFTGRYQL